MSIIIMIIIITAWLASAVWSILEMTNENLKQRTVLAFIVFLGISTILVIIIFTTMIVNI